MSVIYWLDNSLPLFLKHVDMKSPALNGHFSPRLISKLTVVEVGR